jgi:hypothetical protein
MWTCQNVSNGKYTNESINKISEFENKRLKKGVIEQNLPWFLRFHISS